MNCLLCQNKLSPIPKFYELFLLKAPPETLCTRCAAKFEKISPAHCPRCYKSGSAEVCADCQTWEKQGIIIRHQAIFKYNGAMQEFFSQYKFLGDYRLRQVFAPYFVKFDRNYTVVPIPVSPKRYQERGFNQVTAFLPSGKFSELLVKSDSVKQSSLNRQERLQSANSFSVKFDRKLPDKILLIDDIYTTGATLQHAVATLTVAGCKEIRTFSLAR